MSIHSGATASSLVFSVLIGSAWLVSSTTVCAQQSITPTDQAQRGISLAQKGRCKEAIPVLKSASARVTDKQLRFHAAMLLARCAMSIDQSQAAVQALLLLNREFPNDPEVLYTTTHFYSELASRASQQAGSYGAKLAAGSEVGRGSIGIAGRVGQGRHTISKDSRAGPQGAGDSLSVRTNSAFSNAARSGSREQGISGGTEDQPQQRLGRIHAGGNSAASRGMG